MSDHVLVLAVVAASVAAGLPLGWVFHRFIERLWRWADREPVERRDDRPSTSPAERSGPRDDGRRR